ncbi:hypothetical protein D3C73_1059370 [compost metagenome]
MSVIGNRYQQLLPVLRKRNANLNQQRAVHLEGAVKNRIFHQRLQNHRRDHSELRMLFDFPFHLKSVRVPQLHKPHIMMQQLKLRRQRHQLTVQLHIGMQQLVQGLQQPGYPFGLLQNGEHTDRVDCIVQKMRRNPRP